MMATIGNPSMDPVPLLGGGGGGGDGDRHISRRPSLQGAARFLRRASSRRMLRDPSLLVRERAAETLEGRRSDWAYSRTLVFLDILWNLSFVAVAAGVLIMSLDESPAMPLRLWIVGYALQCVLHMVCVCLEYQTRVMVMRAQLGVGSDEGSSSVGSGTRWSLESGSSRDVEAGVFDGGNGRDEESKSTAKHLESVNTMFSCIWWIMGFYWVSTGGHSLSHDAPQLYWLCIVFLAFDVFFVAFSVFLAFIVGLVVCCCLPCLIAILYAVADQEGASDEDIRQLPKYKFRRMADPENFGSEISGPCGGIMTECGSGPPIEHVLSVDDAKCCICISTYDDGVELRELPCSHHFHCSCIDKWLHINATCPLCKYNIIKSSNQGREEV